MTPLAAASAADPVADRDADVVRRLRSLPGAEDEVVALNEVDPDPGVVLEPVVQDPDDLAKNLVGLGLAVDDPVDGLQRTPERVRRRAHSTGTASSTSVPSKSATARR